MVRCGVTLQLFPRRLNTVGIQINARKNFRIAAVKPAISWKPKSSGDRSQLACHFPT